MSNTQKLTEEPMSNTQELNGSTSETYLPKTTVCVYLTLTFDGNDRCRVNE